MSNKKLIYRLANVLLTVGIILLGVGFLGFKVKSTNAVFPSDALNAFLRNTSTPLLIIGAVLFIAAIVLGTYSRNKRASTMTFFPYLLIAPSIGFLLVFTVYPVFDVNFLSLFSGTVISPTKRYIDLNNYKTIFTINKDFLASLKNTAIYTAIILVLLISLALLFAVWFQKNRKINNLGQAVIFSPYLVASVTAAFVFQWLMDDNSYGAFNTVLKWFGVAPVNWLNNPKTALGCIVVLNLWDKVGYYSLIIMSALKSIPAEIYEAAELDNSSTAKTFFKITLPLLSPQLFFLLITITTGSFKVFDSVNLMTKGGPGNATSVISLFIYKYAFSHNKLGIASAAAVVLMAVLVVVTILDFRFVERKVHYE